MNFICCRRDGYVLSIASIIQHTSVREEKHLANLDRGLLGCSSDFIVNLFPTQADDFNQLIPTNYLRHSINVPSSAEYHEDNHNYDVPYVHPDSCPLPICVYLFTINIWRLCITIQAPVKIISLVLSNSASIEMDLIAVCEHISP